MIAEKITTQVAQNLSKDLKTDVVAPDQFQIFTEATAQDMEGNDVTIRKSIGTFTKEALQKTISDAQAKLDIINQVQ